MKTKRLSNITLRRMTPETLESMRTLADLFLQANAGESPAGKTGNRIRSALSAQWERLRREINEELEARSARSEKPPAQDFHGMIALLAECTIAAENLQTLRDTMSRVLNKCGGINEAGPLAAQLPRFLAQCEELEKLMRWLGGGALGEPPETT